MSPDRALAAREHLHLLFLRQLAQALAGRPYALKGGANLRFYFQSPRFSEDIDLDVRQVASKTLVKHVSAILSSPALRQGLAVEGVREVRPQAAGTREDTETTQRWKVHVVLDEGTDLSSKIEFSRRGGADEAVAEPPSAEVLAAHRLVPFLARHYPAHLAVAQKVGALANPDRTAARDVFDLHHLAALYPGEFARALAQTDAGLAKRCRDKVVGFRLADFEGQVGAFLAAPLAGSFRAEPERWERLQLELLERLEGGAP